MAFMPEADALLLQQQLAQDLPSLHRMPLRQSCPVLQVRAQFLFGPPRVKRGDRCAVEQCKFRVNILSCLSMLGQPVSLEP
jgi:hypothetical protein